MCRSDDFPPYEPAPLDELPATGDREHFRLTAPSPLPGLVGHECLAPHVVESDQLRNVGYCIRVTGHTGRHVFAWAAR